MEVNFLILAGKNTKWNVTRNLEKDKWRTLSNGENIEDYKPS